MTPTAYVKPVPNSIAIFGASGHIGGPMARFLRYHAPHIRLRLISSNADKLELLRQEHPGVEVVQADYFDPASLDAAVAGIQGMLVITTTMLDERPAMTNLVAAVRKSGSLIHMIRQVGLMPDSNPKRIPKVLRDFRLGLETQHPIARQILDEAELPVTYLNCGASFMDNYLRMAGSIQEGVLRWHNRRVPYLDPREVGEAAARLLLSDDSRHVGQLYTINNGEPGLRPSDAAQMLSEMLMRQIAHDGSREGLFSFFQPLIDAGLVPAFVPEYLWNMFEYEDANEHVWVPNQFLENLLGRKPMTLRNWLREHLHHFGDVAPPELARDTPARVLREGSAVNAAPASAASIDGVWDCTVATPVGKEPHELIVRCTPDGSLEGEMKSVKSGAVMPLQDGRVNGNTLTWTMQLLKPIKLTLKAEVQINGNELAGHAKAGMVGKVAVSGTKRS